VITKERALLAGMAVFGGFIGAQVGGSGLHALAGIAAGLVGAGVIIVLDRMDPKQ